MKNIRHERLLKIIAENVINTQDELQQRLVDEGFKVTQSTVSRDIKQLRIIKTHDSDGNYRYISRSDGAVSKHSDTQKYIDVFVNSVISVEYAMNDVVIKCYSGMASSACVMIDTLFHEMIIGSLAGDDTIFVITRDEATAAALVKKLKELF